MASTIHESLMLSELREQPAALRRLLHDAQSLMQSDLQGAVAVLQAPRLVLLVGCGSSYHAADTAVHALRAHGVAAFAVVASEAANNIGFFAQASHVIAVSQSGHTGDTLAAMRVAKSCGLPIVSVVADAAAPMAHMADACLVTRSGPERAIPSTKGFSCQLATLWLLIKAMHPNTQPSLDACASLAGLPDHVQAVIDCESAIAQAATRISDADSHVFLGSGANFAIACEGALKMKESARIPAQAYPTLEVRHGPLAALGQRTPALLWHADDAHHDAISALAMQLKRCGVFVTLVAPNKVAAALREACDAVLTLPDAPTVLAPAMGAVAFQLLAYHAARALGRDMDAPPNLVKSVV